MDAKDGLSAREISMDEQMWSELVHGVLEEHIHALCAVCKVVQIGDMFQPLLRHPYVHKLAIKTH
jgi:hypothetical protein